jgi:hypothetical protein
LGQVLFVIIGTVSRWVIERELRKADMIQSVDEAISAAGTGLLAVAALTTYAITVETCAVPLS